MKVLITTVPFGAHDSRPIDLLNGAETDYVLNPSGKKLTEDELAGILSGYDAVIAGTEPITERVLDKATSLKHISRVGIGLDSVDLNAARKRGIRVSYTPDAPTKAVSELTLCLMLSLLRQVHISNSQMHSGRWRRLMGRRLGEVTVGLIGVGRVGTGVMSRLQGFGCPRILVNDIRPNRSLDAAFDFEWTDKDTIYREADVVSLHLPLTKQTKHMIRRPEIEIMKSDALLINTARGGIVHEQDLCEVMQSGHLAAAAIFEQEPYDGPLREIERCMLTAHMGSMSADCRARMELEATEEVVRFILGKELQSEVPDVEYEAQA